MNNIKLLLLSLVLFSSPLFSQVMEHPIDKFSSDCMNENGSTMGIIKCNDEAYLLWDEEMNKYYKLLKDILDEEAFAKLKAAQLKWIEFRDLEIENGNGIYGFIYDTAGGGTMYPMIASGIKVEIVKARTLDLKLYYDSIMEFVGDVLNEN